MAPQLWLLRHGEAVPHESKPDSRARADRPRRATGARRGRGARPARRGVRRLLHEPEGARARRPPSWPAARSASSRSSRTSLGNGFDRDDALALLRAHGDDARVLVVGHKPTFAQVVHDLTGARVDFKKGGVAARARRARRRGELLVLLRPRELESLALGAT